MRVDITYKNGIVTVISYLYILLFVYAAVSKLLDFENFTVQLGQSPLLSAFAGWVAWVVPLAEILIAILISLQRLKLLGLALAYFLMVMFTMYIFIILRYSSFVPCSCGGILEQLGWTQHLIFNVVFLIMALVAINFLYFSKVPTLHRNFIKFILITFAVTLAGCASVYILFLKSEKIIHKENNFVRRYMDVTSKKYLINLNYNSYYFAGLSADSIYLGNHTVPLLITQIDTSFKSRQEHSIILSPQLNIFNSAQIRVSTPNFYFIDGTISTVYKGTVSNWKAQKVWSSSLSFSHAQVVDPNTLVCRTISEEEMAQLSLIELNKNTTPAHFPALLTKQIDGLFDSDGSLLYAVETKKIIYVYRYRNQIVIADNKLQLLGYSKTIDTVRKAQIKIAHIATHNERKFATPPLVVNKSSAVHKNLLFVNSALVGKHEPKDLWNHASIIDVYDIDKNEYVLSFYIYNEGGKVLSAFLVHDTCLYGIIGTHLVRYDFSLLLAAHYNN